MVIDQEQENVLLELLNTTPVVDGAVQDRLNAPGAKAWQRAHGGNGTEEERGHLVRAREILQDAVRGTTTPTPCSNSLTASSIAPASAMRAWFGTCRLHRSVEQPYRRY